MGMWCKPKPPMLITAVVLLVANDTQLLLRLRIDGLGVIIPVSVYYAGFFKEPFRILRYLDGVGLACALRTSLLLEGMIVRRLFEFSMIWADYGDLLPPGPQIDLGIVILVPVDSVSLIKEIL